MLDALVGGFDAGLQIILVDLENPRDGFLSGEGKGEEQNQEATLRHLELDGFHVSVVKFDRKYVSLRLPDLRPYLFNGCALDGELDGLALPIIQDRAVTEFERHD